ncbi:MAG TPA: flagellar biosynthesis protein FlhB [Nitrospirota bacterium]|jgi:flagellar biosynthetic protein FlhB
MSEDSGQERSEQATPKRREEARNKGQVARSKDVPFAAILVAAVISALAFHAGSTGMKAMMRDALGSCCTKDMTVTELSSLFLGFCWTFLKVTGPLFLAMAAAAGISNLAMVGFMVSEEALGPDMKRIDPIQGFKRIISLQAVLEFAKSSFKVVVIGAVMYAYFRNMAPSLPMLMDADVPGIADYWLRATVRMLIYAAIAIGGLSVVDYVHQRWEHEKKLRMSKEEIKEEMKHTDGDPMVKGRQRAIQRDLARRRMMQNVPKADVVLTNPTHLAVALKYDPGKGAPKVLAKGAGKIAEKIKEIAKASGVMIIENKPLARAIYKKVEIGREIPVELYQAVAEVLAYIYGLGRSREKLKKRI